MRVYLSDATFSAHVIFCLVGLFLANVCFAAEHTIEIVKAEGTVATRDSSGEQERAVAAKSVLLPKNVLTTGSNGRAVVRMGPAGIVVLGNNSKIEIDNSKSHAGFLRQITGTIYYATNRIEGNQKLEVHTQKAIVGIRGTRFLIVDLPGRNEIDVRKGVLSVTSPEGEFEIHRKAEQEEFEAYKQEGKVAIEKEKKAFDEYQEKIQREFVEYKRQFSLGANRMASFNGEYVDDRPLSAESNKDMESAESYAEEWLKEVRD